MLESKNSNVESTNFLIKSYDIILEQLRNKEKEYLLRKRKEEYERIRPPVNKWWEMKSNNFTKEELRNKMIMTASPSYFSKLKQLQDDELY